MNSRTGLASRAIFLATICLFVGCRSKREATSFERFKPAPANAHAALIAVLNAWKKGAAVGAVADSAAPALFVVDTARLKEPALLDFEVLSETPSPTSRCLTARLTFAETDESVLAKFHVFGIDPLWIYRQVDYDMISHWEHPMEPNDRAEIEFEKSEPIENAATNKTE